MKISVLLPNTAMGGAEKLHFNLIDDWLKRDFDVELIVLFDLPSRSKDDAISLLNPKCKVRYLHLTKFRHSLFSLIRVFRSNQDDIILAPMWPLTCISIMAWLLSGSKAKLFISEHTNITASFLNETKTNLFLIRLSQFCLYRFASGIIAVSKGVQDDIAQLAKISTQEVKVIYNPVINGLTTTSAEMIREYEQHYWDPKYPLRILGVGTLKEQKNFSLLLKAFNSLSANIRSKSQLVILGDGPLKENLLSEIKHYDLKNQIFLKGNVLETHPWYSSASLFVLSSSWEGFGNVLVEALECGTPIVSTDCKSGPSEILDNGRFGRLVPINDCEALKNAIESSLAARHDPNTLKKRAQDFLISKISLEYLNFFIKDISSK
jgi:glycosyltransferase involved in cell wall biosynthesis